MPRKQKSKIKRRRKRDQEMNGSGAARGLLDCYRSMVDEDPTKIQRRSNQSLLLLLSLIFRLLCYLYAPLGALGYVLASKY